MLLLCICISKWTGHNNGKGKKIREKSKKKKEIQKDEDLAAFSHRSYTTQARAFHLHNVFQPFCVCVCVG
jgi:hypothetical protein